MADDNSQLGYRVRLAPMCWSGVVLGAWSALSVLLVTVWAAPPPEAAPALAASRALSPEEAAGRFQVAAGLKLELAASEPLVESPVAVAFDERGRMFVAENRGYPTGGGPGSPPLGRIVMLEDTKGDGHYDRRTVFAEGLSFPNGLAPWKGGWIVTCSPDILYLKDTDGDGRADQREVWLTGFSTKGSTQLRASHPTLASDGWFYVTSGLTGGKVTIPSHPELPAVEYGRTDLRFRPDLSAVETCDGGGQFGLALDDFDRRFVCYNRVQVQHVVLEAKLLRRNKHLPAVDSLQNCPAELAPEPLAGHGRAARLYPISRNITTADSHAGTFTAACGLCLFGGDGLTAELRGAVLSCDPTGNLVHADRLSESGATFSAAAIFAGKELAASSDDWTRPVFLGQGPDGALYICDMVRQTIEHPEYLPEEIRKRTNFDGGKGYGRLWRLIRSDAPAEELRRRRKENLGALSSEQLAARLLHADSWQRRTAFRLLLERSDAATATAAEAIATNEKAPAAGVALAMSLLKLQGKLTEQQLLRGLTDREPPLRERSIELAWDRLRQSPQTAEKIVGLIHDRSPRVAMRAALAIGEIRPPGGAELLAETLVSRLPDRWLRAAALSSCGGMEKEVLAAVLARIRPVPADQAPLAAELARTLADGLSPAEAAQVVVQALADQKGETVDVRRGLLVGLARSLRGRLTSPAGPLFAAVEAAGKESAAGKQLQSLLEDSLAIGRDPHQETHRRKGAIALAAECDTAAAADALLGLVSRQEAIELQAAAVRGLGQQSAERIGGALLEARRFAEYPPAVREEVLSALLGSPVHQKALLKAIAAGSVPVHAVDSLRRGQLLQHSQAEIRELAQKAFASAGQADRMKVYESLKDAARAPGKAGGGHAAFRKLCANCHRLDQEGTAVGPDLFGMRNQSKETILLHILVPEYEIAPNFMAYTVETEDGKVLTGLLAGETETSVSLRGALGKEESVPRSQIARMQASKLSLMPQEFEKQLSRQDLSDLLSYLKGEGE